MFHMSIHCLRREPFQWRYKIIDISLIEIAFKHADEIHLSTKCEFPPNLRYTILKITALFSSSDVCAFRNAIYSSYIGMSSLASILKSYIFFLLPLSKAFVNSNKYAMQREKEKNVCHVFRDCEAIAPFFRNENMNFRLANFFSIFFFCCCWMFA